MSGGVKGVGVAGAGEEVGALVGWLVEVGKAEAVGLGMVGTTAVSVPISISPAA